jgi:hypothetical protein
VLSGISRMADTDTKITELLATAPLLTDEQLARVDALLAPLPSEPEALTA